MCYNVSESIQIIDFDDIPDSKWKPYLIITMSIVTLGILIFGQMVKIPSTLKRLKERREERSLNEETNKETN